MRALELLELGELEPPERALAAVERASCAIRRCSSGLTMEREALYAAIDARVERMVAAGAREEVARAHAAGASETARKALGFDELLRGDVEAMKRRTRNYARRQLTWMRKLAGVRLIDVTGRDPGSVAREILALRPLVRFEKWQALGNDYLIVERDELPFELTPGRVRMLCEGHFGVFADGVLLLSEPSDARDVADLRIFNPDGSEAELSGNGAREAVLYLRRHGWTDEERFSIATAAGRISPRSPGRHVHRRHGLGDAPLARLSRRRRGWRRRALRGRARVALPARLDRQPPVLDPRRLARGARGARARRVGPPIEADARFPNRTNVSWYAELEPPNEGRSRIAARIFERGVGETLASGTGASGAAVAYALERRPGAEEPLRVAVELDGGELEVEVGTGLHVNLTGWAKPVFSGVLSDVFAKELHETE